MTATGTITGNGVRFERRYDAPPEQVWAALTEPEQLGGWLARAVRWSLAPGDEYELAFDDGSAGGRVVAVEAERLLELTWSSPGEPESVVRFELRPAGGGGCVLVLEHTRLTGEARAGYGAGWQSHLENLESLLAGTSTGGADGWWERFRELQPEYEALAAAD